MDLVDLKMFEAVRDNNIDAVNGLFEQGFNPLHICETENWNLLHRYTFFVNATLVPAMIKCLHSHGVLVNGLDRNGWTPLHFAARHNNCEVVKALIDAGADVNMRNKDGHPPLLLALKQQPFDKNVVRLFLENGTDLDMEIGDRKLRECLAVLSHGENKWLESLIT